MRTTLYVCLIALLSMPLLSQECSISNLFYEVSECNGDGQVTVDFEFDFDNTGATFSVIGNGTNYGDFEYGETFYTIGPINGDCETEYELVIIDNEHPACIAEAVIGEICCSTEPCSISNLIAEAHDCEGTEFMVDLAFEVNNPVSASFYILAQGQIFGPYQYGETFYTFGPLMGDCIQNNSITVFDSEDPFCISNYVLGPICCESEECSISNIVIETGQCNGDSSFFANLNFDFSNVGDLGYDVSINGAYFGNYDYANLPINIVNFPDMGNLENELVLCDRANPTCCDTIFVYSPCYCGMATMTADILSCENDSFFVELNFVPGQNSDSFTIGGNGNVYGTYSYSELPVTLGPLPADETNYEFIFLDSEDPLCFEFIEVGQVDCSIENECDFQAINVEFGECNSDNQFYAFLQFEITNPGNGGFTVQGNGVNYGNFEYGESVYVLGPLDGNCETIYEFVVIDIENPLCQVIYESTEPICCETECEIWDIIVDPGECTGNGVYSLVLNFNYQGNTNQFFDVYSNGELVGFYSYSDLPITIEEFPERDAEFDIITICDNDNPECCASFEFLGPDCTETECEIWDIVVEPGECTGNGTYSIWLNFNYQGNTNEFFDVYSDGNLVGFYSYADLPITIQEFPEREAEFDIITICDNDNPGCCASLEFLGPDCSELTCEIWDITVDPGECTGNGLYSLVLNFNYQGNTNDFFDVYSDGNLVGFYAYGDLPITIEEFPEREAEYDIITICDNDNPDCCASLEFIGTDCTEATCEIWDVIAEAYTCEGDSFYVDITFNVEGGSDFGFKIVGNGIFHGEFEYGLDFYTIGPLYGDCETLYEFIIMDLEDESCMAFTGFEEPICCEEENCIIDEVVIDDLICNENNLYNFWLDFNHSGTTNEFFDLYSSEGIFGFYAFADLPLQIVDFPVGEDQLQVLAICENDNESCCIEIQFEGINCDPSSAEGIDFQTFKINTTQDGFTIKSQEYLELEVALFSINGQFLSRLSSMNNQWKLNMQTAPSGVYIIKLQSGKSSTNIKQVWITN